MYLYTHILALFSSQPYSAPVEGVHDGPDARALAGHLTNTSLQTERGEQGVRLLAELVGSTVLSSGAHRSECETLSADDVVTVQDQIADVLAEMFDAALATPVHFQVNHVPCRYFLVLL